MYPKELSFRAESRVVLVGTTVCPEDSGRLPAIPQVANNILSLAYLFSQPDVIGLPPENIIRLLDIAEAGAISRAVAREALVSTDTLIVYYAGHGLYGDDDGCPLYLAATTTTSESKWISAVRITDIKRAMRNSPARKRILILDCCYSGRGLPGAMSSVDEDVNIAIDIEGTYGIAAVPGDYKALAPPGEQFTSFTKSLINVLEKGVPAAGAVLSVDEIFKEVKAQVSRESDMPLPQRINWNDGALFKLAKNRANIHTRKETTNDDRVKTVVQRFDKAFKSTSNNVYLVHRVSGHFAVAAFLTNSSGSRVKSVPRESFGAKLIIEVENLSSIPRDVAVIVTAKTGVLSLNGGRFFNYGFSASAPAMTRIIEIPVTILSSAREPIETIEIGLRQKPPNTVWKKEEALLFQVRVR